MMPHLTEWNSTLLSGLNFCAAQPLVAVSSKGSQAVILGLGLVLSVILTAVLCGLYFLARNRPGLAVDDPNSIFRDLCRTHDLTVQERRLMRRLATGLSLPCPSALFIDSSLWILPDGSDGQQRLSATEWDKLLKLQRVLFLPPPAKVVT